MKLDNLTEQEETRRGRLIAENLKLKKSKDHPDRWNTEWGTKSDLGLFRIIKRFIIDGE